MVFLAGNINANKSKHFSVEFSHSLSNLLAYSNAKPFERRYLKEIFLQLLGICRIQIGTVWGLKLSFIRNSIGAAITSPKLIEKKWEKTRT